MEIDFKLLKVLKVLLDVNNTTKAAELLHMSQPNVSKALTRLRKHFNDPLFIRQSHGLQPTARATELARQLPPLLAQLENLVNDNQPFDPQSLEGKVTIAANSFIFHWIGQTLSQRIRQQAPNIELHFAHWNDDSEQALLKGTLDIGINYFSTVISNQVHQHKVTRDDFVYVLREGHPIEQEVLPIQSFSQYSIASLIIPNWNVQQSKLEETLAQHVKDLKPQFRCSDVSMLLEMVKTSDIIFPCSRFLAQTLDPNEFKLSHASPEITKPNGTVVVLTDNLRRQDKMIKWLTEQIELHPLIQQS